MNIKTLLSSVVGGVLVVGVAFGIFWNRETPVVHIGAVLPFSGGASGSAEASRLGFALALEDFGTSSVVITYADSHLSPDIGAQEAQRLIDEGADVIFSSYTAVTAGVSDVTREAQKVLFYDSCNCGFSEENPYAFQLYFDPRKECRVAAEHFKNVGALPVAFIGQDIPYAAFCYDTMRKTLGEANVFVELEPADGIRDYAGVFHALASNDIKAVVSVPLARDFSELFEVNETSLRAPVVCFEGACLSKIIIEQTEDTALEYVTAFGLTVSELFAERVLALHPDFSYEQLLAAAIAYDVVQYTHVATEMCHSRSTACRTRALSRVHLPSPAVSADGFGEDRILDYITRYVRYEGGVRVPTELQK